MRGPLTRSSINNNASKDKGVKYIPTIDFTTSTSAVRRENTKHYSECSSLVPQSLLGYVSTQNSFKLDENTWIFDLFFPYEERLPHEAELSFFLEGWR